MATDEQISQLLYTLRQTMKQYQRILHQEWQGVSLTLPQASAIMMLKRYGPQSLAELSKKMQTSMSSLSGIIDRLEKMQLVERKRDQRDRRIVWIHLTPKCKEIIRNFPNTEAQIFRKYLIHWPEQDLELLIQKLTELLDLLKKEAK